MLADFQNALVRLLTDAEVRKRFVHDRAAALSEYRLDEAERAALIALPGPALERFAHSLVHKRWREVASVVPLTQRVVPSLGVRYRRWLARHPAPAADDCNLSPGAREALRAVPALMREIARDEAEAEYAPDLLGFETLAACSRHDGRVRSFRAGFDMHAIATDLQAGLLPIDPDPAPTRYRFEGTRVTWRSEQ